MLVAGAVAAPSPTSDDDDVSLTSVHVKPAAALEGIQDDEVAGGVAEELGGCDVEPAPEPPKMQDLENAAAMAKDELRKTKEERDRRVAATKEECKHKAKKLACEHCTFSRAMLP
eukprot:m51a1_g11537 hypothetical protein (115) ;mRNA; r:3678-4848